MSKLKTAFEFIKIMVGIFAFLFLFTAVWVVTP